MTTWLLDGNLLVALRLNTHAHHVDAHRWFASFGEADRFATCAVTEGTLLRIHMIHAVDRSAPAAWAALAEIAAHPQHVFWDEAPSYQGVPHRMLQGHRQVTDAWLAELARLRGGLLATFDAALAELHRDVARLVRRRPPGGAAAG